MKTAALRKSGHACPRLVEDPPSSGSPSTHSQRLWMGVHLLQLPLEAHCRNVDSGAPTVVVEGEGVRSRVVALNESAMAVGADIGMRVNAVYALAPQLQVIHRDERLEATVLEGLVGWCEQFTSVVSLTPPAGLLLEIGASLALFGNLEALVERFRAGLKRIGYRHCTAVAPTPLAASLLARAGFSEAIRSPQSLAGGLARIPLACTDLPEKIREELRAMGVKHFGDCYRLPRDGLSRRVGPVVIDTIDRALGRCPDPRQPHRAAVEFERRLGFPAEVREVEVVLHGASRLLEELCGFLRARALGVRALAVHLAHRGQSDTRIAITLIAPQRDPQHLLHLLRERLERLQIVQPIEYLGLRAVDFASLAPTSRDLYATSSSPSEDWNTLVERLRARLSNDVVQGLALVADHRPERAWKAITPAERRASNSGPNSIRNATQDRNSMSLGPGQRPAWLLDAPRPLEARKAQGGGIYFRNPDDRSFSLFSLAGPERIESGWWDGGDIARDYYLACASDGERYWVFRERRGERGWFLHGIFA